MRRVPALCGLQAHRSEPRQLGPHFGFTLVQADVLRRMGRPWFRHVAEFEDDAGFWRNWSEAGHDVVFAEDVRIGHCEECVRFPDGSIRRIADVMRGEPCLT